MAVKPKQGRPRKWKQCPGCLRRKLIAEDYYNWHDRADGNRPRVSRLCKECVKARRREAYTETISDPYLRRKLIERQRQWARAKQRNNAERCRRYRERLKAERPEEYQRQLEDQRIRGRLAREAKGKARTTPRAVFKEAPVPKVPVGPLVEFLGRVDRTGISLKGDYAARATYHVLHEVDVTATVPMTLADTVLTAFDGSLAAVYPELYA